jgi:deoxyribodipyrimidine photolyase-related protein
MPDLYFRFLHQLGFALPLPEPGDTVLLIESRDRLTDVRHHKHKLVLWLSAARHFAEEMRASGHVVDYRPLTRAAPLADLLRDAIAEHRPTRVHVVKPTDWQDRELVAELGKMLGDRLVLHEDSRFLTPPGFFAEWTSGRKQWRMEFFYREMRKMSGLLMAGTKPEGGEWNFDAENRASLPAGVVVPDAVQFAPDEMTREVMALVEAQFPDHPGRTENFGWPVTRGEALTLLDRFIDERLRNFGTYQDAMKTGEPVLFHGMIAAAMNIGLIDAREICKRAEAAYYRGDVPLNAAEGFIRQILGWREYVRELYLALMPAYRESNALRAERPLPWFYWSGETDLNCLKHAIDQTLEHAYAHHIQRLMVTGNFALLAGFRPAEVEAWYLAVYADAFEWVELPNTHGMALYADGGRMASKPYAGSGAYISRMSDYCSGCRYDPKDALGEKACPFNALYWHFLDRNREVLKGNPRLAMPYRTLERFAPERRAALNAKAIGFLNGLEGKGTAPAPAAQQLSLL